ncbi:MAG: hypothetical protein N3D11_14705 [Candidatus Sumerlaeia bacterium]|nr:hypothetical protein [Candidatus Sumerlaeia bacterium]
MTHQAIIPLAVASSAFQTRTTLILTVLSLLSATAAGIQTGRVELGQNGVYDGTVCVSRSTTGSLTFRDQDVAATVTLSQLLAGRNDHGHLTGLGDDDHAHYLNDARHWQRHTADYNAELPTPPDVGNNTTLGGHIEDGQIHVLKNAAEIIAGAWRFTGTPLFVGTLRIEPQAPGPNAVLEFGAGYNSPRLSYFGSPGEFEFSRPVRATSASLAHLAAGTARIHATLDGRGLSGLPEAALVHFASLNGIAAGNLLSRAANEDIAGQWDFLSPVRVFGSLSCADALATGPITAPRLILDGGNALATTAALTIRSLGSAPTRGIDLSNSGLSGSGDYLLYESPTRHWRADGVFKTSSQIDCANMFTAEVSGFGHTNLSLKTSANSRYVHIQSHEDIWLDLNDSAGAKKVKIRDLADATVWQCDSDGNVAMAADARLTLPDGSDAPFILNIHPAAAYVAGASNLSPTQHLPCLTFAASGNVCFAFAVPADSLGAHVVIDRITIVCAQSGGSGTVIDEVSLVDDAGAAVIQHTDDLTATHQIVDADYTMDDNKSYLLKLVFSNSGAGAMNLYRFKVEYHLE